MRVLWRLCRAALFGGVAAGIVLAVLWNAAGADAAFRGAVVIGGGIGLLAFIFGPGLPGVKQDQPKTSLYAPFNWRQ